MQDINAKVLKTRTFYTNLVNIAIIKTNNCSKINTKENMSMFERLKFYMLGLLTGFIFVGGLSYADEGFYQLQKMECAIWSNGKEVSMDMPVLNYNGSSYVPLRKFSEVAGANIEWNPETKIIQLMPDINEVIKEVPREVVKEVSVEKIVTKEVPIKDAIYVTKQDGMYWFQDMDSSETGFMFGIDFNKGVGTFIRKINGNEIDSKTYVVEKSLPSSNLSQVQSPEQTDYTSTYNAEYTNLESTYNLKTQSIKDDYQKLRNDAAVRKEMTLKGNREKLANMGISGGDTTIIEGNVNNTYNAEINRIDAAEKPELDQLKINLDHDVSMLKIKYNIK